MRRHPLLDELGRYGVKLGLSRMSALLAELGSPHLEVPVIHVAGTNGKGSVVALLEGILAAQGYRVGCFTSPHLDHVNERVRVCGAPVSDVVFDEGLRAVDAVRKRWATEGLDTPGGADHALTYFEMVTAAALRIFSRAELDVIVVEVGLGGRLDATNVVEPLVSVIVSVGIDHVDQLGPDLASIAAEKAGVIKEGRPVVTGPLRGPALRVIRSIAAERDAPLHAWGESFRVSAGRADGLAFAGGAWNLRGLKVGMEGEHQLENAGVALACLSLLPERLAVDEAAIRTGLESARHAGRLEWLDRGLLVDCAHNADGAARLAAYLGGHKVEGPRTLLVGMSADKDPRALVVTLAPHFDRVLTTRCAHPRALEAGDLAAALVDVDLPVLPAGAVEEALPHARAGGGLVVVAGSVFLAGAVRVLVGAS